MEHHQLFTVCATLAQELNEQNSLEDHIITTKEAMDEASLYKKLSQQLIELETMTNYNVEQIQPIREMVEKMFVAMEEKSELLMRCDWLEVMKAVEQNIATHESLESVQAAKRQLARVQTCPLKTKLKAQLEQLESQFVTTETLSAKEQLVEDIFATGNETFINLGTAGREYVLQQSPSVELAIAKAEALEEQVQVAKKAMTAEELKAKLEELPLINLAKIPAMYEQEILEKVMAQPKWNGLFHLDLLIHQCTTQIKKSYMPVQEGALETLVVDEKVVERLGLQIQQNYKA